jgi:hypothetical protein
VKNIGIFCFGIVILFCFSLNFVYADPCNGTEVNLTNNISNCGTCGNVCGPYPNAQPGCSNSICVIQSCNANYYDFDGILATGCEWGSRPGNNITVDMNLINTIINLGEIAEFKINITNRDPYSFSLRNIKLNFTYNASCLSFNISNSINPSQLVNGTLYWANLTNGTQVLVGNSYVLYLNMTPVSYCSSVLSSVSVNGTTITQNATSKNSSILINITDSVYPKITIYSPINRTYHNSSAISLDFGVSETNLDKIWYTIDNGIHNTTITENTTFNTNEGAKTLKIYANDSYGNLNSSLITFRVNNTLLVLSYDKFRLNGSTTDLNNINSIDSQNLTNFILEIANIGKISFNIGVNLTKDSDNNKELDLDDYINITNNYIYINSSALTSLNVSATLVLYGLSFSSPRILRNGEVCPSTICTGAVYNSGTLTFNVSGFSSYSAQETPGSGSSSSSSSSSGGGSSIGRAIDFWITTYIVNETQLILNYTKELTARQRLKFTIDNEIYYLGIVSLTTDSAVINLSSTSIKTTLNSKESKKFELTNDSYYDLLVRLNRITEDNRANITITLIHEEIFKSAEEIPTTPATENNQEPIDTNKEITPKIDKTQDKIKNKNSYWIYILILIVLVCGVLLFFIRKRNQKRRIEEFFSYSKYHNHKIKAHSRK